MVSLGYSFTNRDIDIMLDRAWAKPVLERRQGLMFASLDTLLPHDHMIRVVDAVLAEMDWSEWERPYLNEDRRGQPPIHPSRVAGCILYGLTRKIRSSRELEEATRERLDFQWFLEGRTIDHATFAAFRTRFKAMLKDLNRSLVKLISQAYKDALEMLVSDGTRERANSDRHGARTAEGLQRLIERYTRTLDERLEQMEAVDAQDSSASGHIAQLEKEIGRLEARIAKYETAAEVARKRDQARRAKMGSKAAPVSVPVTDPDSMIVPNKEGGHAPNYTPAVTVDAASGAIVLGHVPEGAQENTIILPAVEEAKHLGVTPRRVMADTAFASGPNLEGLAAQEIEAVMPTGTDFRPSNPANRPDPTQPVPQDQWQDLPKSGGTFRSSAFIYDTEHDAYLCPMGKPLTPHDKGRRRTGAGYTSYICAGCQGCPLSPQCLAKGAAARTVTRDQYQHLRDETGRRMATEEGIALYKKRAPLVETVFARIKQHMGIRGFLLRGLDKVRTEWDWICCAYNLKILLRTLLGMQGSPVFATIKGVHTVFSCPTRTIRLIDSTSVFISAATVDRILTA